MKKDGFIATSLIYSFFLVFVAVLAALVNGYVANKTIQDRFNDEIEDSLNIDSHFIKIYSHNSELPDGTVLENLVLYGDLSNSTDLAKWTKVGSTTFATATSNGGIRLNNIKSSSYLTQNIETMIENHKYYISVDYNQASNVQLKTYLYNQSYGITTSGIQTTWMRQSTIITAPTSGLNVPFILGASTASYTGPVYLRHAMVIDLTDSYGAGDEPTSEWLDKNLDFIDGRTGFLMLDNVKQSSSCDLNSDDGEGCLKVTVRPYAAYSNPLNEPDKDSFEPYITCKPAELESTLKFHNVINNREYFIFWIKPTFKNDLVCDINWRKL